MVVGVLCVRPGTQFLNVLVWEVCVVRAEVILYAAYVEPGQFGGE